MYKMIIVDDELATREGIRKAVNWEALDIVIAGEAADGEAALKLAERTHPQIAICDIMMPHVDGLQLANLLYQKNPDIQILFLSGYSDKDFLRSAIRLHVVDYLYKPFELVELIQAVEKCKVACRQRASQNYRQANDLALQLLGNDVLTDMPLPIDLNRQVFTMILRLHPHSNASAPFSIFDAKVISSHYAGAISSVLEQCFGSHYLMSPLDANYVVHANVREASWKSPSMAHRLNALFDLLPDFTLSIGVGSPQIGRTGIKDSFRQARRAVDSAFLSGTGQLIWCDDVGSAPFHPPEDIRETLRGILAPHSIAGAPAYIDALIDDMRFCAPEYIPQIRETLTEISLAVFQAVRQMDVEAIPEGHSVTDILSSAPDISMIRSTLLEVLGRTYRETMMREQKGKIVYDAERYILENIMKPLTVRSIANSAFVTPNYLCYLYKQKTGRTLTQFILEMKMNKARKMLLETDFSVGEIAEQLGYSSQSYFARRFYSQFRQTPSDYRSRNHLPDSKEVP